MNEQKQQYTAKQLDEIARQEKNRYQREWFRNHPEKQKQYQRNFYLRKAGIEPTLNTEGT